MIIGLAGAARSGKDTVADYLDKHLGGVYRLQIAGSLKRILRDMFDWTEAHTDGDLKDKPDPRYPRPCPTCAGHGRLVLYHEYDCSSCMGTGKVFLVPREAMQWLGDVPFYGPVWAEKAAREAKVREADGAPVVVTDCRFLRDIQALKNVGATIVQVHRDGAGLTGAAALHRGEVERNSVEFQSLVDHHIYNDGTLEDLETVVAARFGSVVTAHG